ncbi:hypothetical protein M9Y10_041711 [Tritrichomonas musculus]|uniref:Thioredoxin domain-containing protein n=1 Tax=Tritrichomonas musculus TaxID=1915356 RepID=A0ABR2K647_9EUKA
MIFLTFFLHFFVNSVYVPYHNTETPILLQFTDKELAYSKNLYRPFLVLVINDYARANNEEVIRTISQISLEFGEKVLIGMMRESRANQIYEDIQKHLHGQNQFLYSPFIVYYDVGRPIYVTSLINDEVAITHTLNFWINGPKIVSNFKELMEALGNSPLSIISKKSALKEAFNITSKALITSGPVDLIQAEDDLFKMLNLPNHNFSVFVKEDMSINGFTNYDEFLKYSLPHFKIFEQNDITSNIYNQENDIVAIFDTNLKPEYNNTLYYLKEKYPQYLYGIVDKKSLFDVYSYYTHQDIKDLPAALIFNREKRFYYPLPQNLNNEPNMTSLLNKYVKSVVEERIQKEYMSEELNETVSDIENDVTRLVGNNFENFVNDTETDSLIFFETPQNWPFYFKFFQYAQGNVSSLGVKMKFGYIDPTKNSSPYRFPKIYSNPLIELYLKDGTMIPMLNIVNEEGIMRFLHFFASDGNRIPATNFTSSQARSERYRISSVYHIFYDEYIDLFNSMFENIDNPTHIS